MEMEVMHGLPPVAPVVHHQAIPRGLQSGLPCHRLGSQEETPGKGRLRGVHFRDGGDVGPGDEKDVGGGLGGQVPERQNFLILVNYLSRDLSFHDATEDASILRGGRHVSIRFSCPNQGASCEPETVVRGGLEQA